MDIFDSRAMVEAIETEFAPHNYLHTTFFRDDQASMVASKHIEIDIWKQKRRMAPFVSPLHEGVLIDRDPVNSFTFTPPYIKPKRSTSAGDALKRGLGQNVYEVGNRTAAQRAAEILGRDLVELEQSIQRRQEQMCSEALFTGAVNVRGEGIEARIDFRRDADLLNLQPTVKWDNGGTPLEDMIAYRARISQASGYVPRLAVMGSEVAKAFRQNDEVQSRLDNDGTRDVNRLNSQELNDMGVTVVAVIDGTTYVTYDDYYVDDAGNEQPMVPVDAVLFANPNANARMYYGMIQDLEADAVVRYWPKSWTQKDPSVRWLLLQSAPLPVTHETDAYGVIRPLSS